MADVYEGPVCYVGHDHEAADGRQLLGGWHYTVVEGPGGEVPGEPLTLADDGTYRPAAPADESWHARKHARAEVFRTVPLDADEEAALERFRRSRGQ